MRASWWTHLKNIALAIVSVVLILFLMEMVLRVTEVAPSRTLEYASPEMWMSNPGPFFPGQVLVDRFTRGYPYKITINDLGFRGPDTPRRKPTGTTRILCLGGARTFGVGVDDAATWPRVLGSTLADRSPVRPIEVINAGVAGFTLVDQIAFLEDHGLDLEPDLIVLETSLEALPPLTRQVSRREELLLISAAADEPPFGPLKRKLRQTCTYNTCLLVGRSLRRLVGGPSDESRAGIPRLVRGDLDGTAEDLLERYRLHLTALAGMVKDRKIQLVLLLLPDWEQITQGAPGQAHAMILEMAAERGLPVVDLLGSYRRIDPLGRKFFTTTPNRLLTARGDRRAALELTAALLPRLGASNSPGGER
ncbi:MAG TPA: SGNH/GDSL hydrolase family protein [Candidatus Polarisedimenticolia bacterium]|nr:SGNH/GDSL hydrolase family protein [Candidatus Polarisedimenticolia bacterium]